MIITFKELGIKVSDYTGHSFAAAYSEIINIACDHIMIMYFFDIGIEEECIPDPLGAQVNFILQTVDIATIGHTIH